MAHSLSFLLSSEAASQRADARKPRFVVHAEVVSGLCRDADRFVELDADDIGHAHTLANTWVNHMGAVSAAIRRCDDDGALHKPCGIIS